MVCGVKIYKIYCKRSAILKLRLKLSTRMPLRYTRMSEWREFLMLLLHFSRKLICFVIFAHIKNKKVFKIRENLPDP